MIITNTKRLIPLTLFIILTFSAHTFAQNEVIRERNSLYGIKEFGVSVNIERPLSLNTVPFKSDSVRQLIIDRLSSLPINIIDDSTLKQSDQLPLLHLHINIMNNVGGVHPFAAELKFYQPVKLPLNKNIQTMGSTWADSFIGVVTPDLMNFIAAKSAGLAENFRSDYEIVN
ncbi:hypothetical protein ACKGJO_11715 [Gracilimonas sp. Q87]|uniref:hypothetical protein n=1 Tax=Gracilimonas sp. Q87 TaxID=3384766 RepID=UPI0039843E5A